MTKQKKKPYRVLDLEQGSAEWLAERRKWVTASEMPSILGIKGAYSNRDKTLKAKVTGVDSIISDHQAALFAGGHAAEISLREAAIRELKMNLSPVVVLNEKFGILASIDGISDDHSTIVEMKYSGAKEVISLARENKAWPPFRTQILAQMLVTGCEAAWLMVLEKETGDAHMVEILPGTEEEAQTIVRAANLFMADMAAGKTGEVEIQDQRMERLKSLLEKEQHILEEIAAPMALLDSVKSEVDALKKAVASEFTHNTILGSGVRISKSKAAETLDRKAIEASGFDVKPYLKTGTQAVRVALIGVEK